MEGAPVNVRRRPSSDTVRGHLATDRSSILPNLILHKGGEPQGGGILWVVITLLTFTSKSTIHEQGRIEYVPVLWCTQTHAIT